MVDAALECGATIVQKCFHMFNPYGVSGVVIISESHLGYPHMAGTWAMPLSIYLPAATSAIRKFLMNF